MLLQHFLKKKQKKNPNPSILFLLQMNKLVICGGQK